MLLYSVLIFHMFKFQFYQLASFILLNRCLGPLKYTIKISAMSPQDFLINFLAEILNKINNSLYLKCLHVLLFKDVS